MPRFYNYVITPDNLGDDKGSLRKRLLISKFIISFRPGLSLWILGK